MADNLLIKDATGTTKTVRTSDQSGADLHIPHHRIGEGVAVAGPAAQSAVNTDLLTGTVNGWFDASLFMSGTVQIVAGAGISAGAIIFEQTNDATSTAGVALGVDELGVINANPLVAAVTIAANTRRIFAFAITCKYIRVRISTGFTGGTVQARAFMSQQPFANPTMNVQQATAADLNATVTGAVSVTGTPSVSIASTIAIPVTDNGGSLTVDGAVSVSNFPATQDINIAQINGAAPSVTNPLSVEPAPTTNCVTAVGASAAALTASLPAAGAGLFHYITKIEIVLFATAARTASATPVTVTSTNLPGSFAETMRADNMSLGQTERIIHDFLMPLKASAANTATTIVCPATTGVLWRVNIFYFTGP